MISTKLRQTAYNASERGFQIEPPLPAYDEPLLVGEKIPDEVRNKPKAANVQTVPTISLANMMAHEYVANWLIDGLIEQ